MNKYKGTDLFRVAFVGDEFLQRVVRHAERTPGISYSARLRALIKRGLQYVDPDTGFFESPNLFVLETMVPYDPPPANRPKFCQVVLREADAVLFSITAAKNKLSHSELARYLVLAGAKDALESAV